MRKQKLFILSFLSILPWVLSGCVNHGTSGSLNTTTDETGQQVGDTMASIDESGGSGSGSVAFQKAFERTLKRLSPADLQEPIWNNFFVQTAYGASCFGPDTFAACNSNVIVHNMDGCTMGDGTFTGNVTLTWGGTSVNCMLQAAGDTIQRQPAFTATGFRGATLTVSQTGTVGQLLTWDSGAIDAKVFKFTNDGIRRVFTLPGGEVLFDFTNTVADDSAITVTGSDRAHRVLDGGVLHVVNNVKGVSCDLVPSSVTWDKTTCNCAVSGSWAGNCSDGTTKTIDITGCGTGTVTVGSEAPVDMTFDRCVETPAH